MQLANNPVYGVNQGTQPIVGFNYGARRFDRVKQALLSGIAFRFELDYRRFHRGDGNTRADLKFVRQLL